MIVRNVPVLRATAMFPEELSEVFGPAGPLAQAQPGYQPRAAQQELAADIMQALADQSVLVAEAGTGTGKTWAYLVPAFLSGVKVLVSTGTRTLQDQLFRRDIPRLRDALALPVDVALLKGRSNYVCHYHLDRLAGDERALRSREEIVYLRDIQRFTRESSTGDKADLPSVPEDADIWNRASSTRENCLGQDCPFVKDCFLLKARRHAQEADLVVVNHALFMADLALREEGITDLLPEVDMVVFDEAHQLPDVATRFLGQSVSMHQIMDFIRACEAAGLAHAREATNWTEALRHVETAARELRLAAAPIAQLPGGRATFLAIPQAEEFDTALLRLIDVFEVTLDVLGLVEAKHPDLGAAAKTAQSLHARLLQWSLPQRGVAEPEAQAAVRWVEQGNHYMRLHRAPLSVAQIFSGFRKPSQTWIFTSATLSVEGDFSHFVEQLGLGDATARSWGSPFDYTQHGLLYVPDGLPLPGQASFSEAFAQSLLPLVDAGAGGVLVLCTTLRAVDRIAEVLAAHLRAVGSPRIVLRQGECSRGQLLQRFRSGGNAILVGSATFWEGIDVPGDALTLVAIDKLPFAPPDDPVIEARLAACRASGGNPFMSHQLPQAAIVLKQGAGRLIRSEQDWGVLVVGDRRLVEKPYGKRLWRGLPPFSRTRDAARALDFLQQRAPTDED